MMQTIQPWSAVVGPSYGALGVAKSERVTLHCGWGRLIFGQTFEASADVADALRCERKGERDIVMYVRDPHVVLSHAPQELFLDPSHTFRMSLADHRPCPPCAVGYAIRPLTSYADAEQVAALYRKRSMVPVAPQLFLDTHEDGALSYLVAEDLVTGEIIGTVTGIDHVEAFGDEENGCSLWALAVDPQTPHAGIGQALVAALLDKFAQQGRAYLDLSVMHDNAQAISLYEKLGFERVPVFCIKRRNGFNEPLYTVHPEDERLSAHARAIVRAGRRRGIAVEVIDPESGYLSLTHGGRTVVCRESLCELTSAVAMSRCTDVAVTRRVLARAGLRSPEREDEHVEGEALRVLVIDYRVVAATLRRPPAIIGDGEHTVRELIEKQSRRRAAATAGRSRIPLDAETERCVREAGYDLERRLAPGVKLPVRKSADARTGGTNHDVTTQLHPWLAAVAKRAAEILDIPVVSFNLVVPALDEPDYHIVRADERPCLIEYEPQPTTERYIDLLFPHTAVSSS